MRVISTLFGRAQIARNTAARARERRRHGIWRGRMHWFCAVWILFGGCSQSCGLLGTPNTGMLKMRAVVAILPFVRVDYCMYGCEHRKRTRIWTNASWAPLLCDRSHLVNGRRAKTAQRAPGRGCCGDRFSRDELRRLPAALRAEIFAVATVDPLR